MERSLGMSDLREALGQPGCALCRLVALTVDRYLGALLWESVNDIALRDSIRRARGFCPEHGRSLRRQGASLGVSIIAHDVLTDVLRVLDADQDQKSLPWSPRRVLQALVPGQSPLSPSETAERLAPEGHCLVCAYVEEMERVYLEMFILGLSEQAGLPAKYRVSDGLCLQHFRQAMSMTRDRTIAETLIDVQRTLWQALVNQLGEAIRKNDWRFRDEPQGDEMKAWLRAIEVLAGS
jgi:hypothetical protein